MFTLTEADDYHDQMLEFGTERDSRFRRSIISGGWAVHNGRLSETEESWVREFEDVPDWLARSYNEDIFSFNRESLPLWTE
jgi:D-amino-acid dehydrogenase